MTWLTLTLRNHFNFKKKTVTDVNEHRYPSKHPIEELSDLISPHSNLEMTPSISRPAAMIYYGFRLPPMIRMHLSVLLLFVWLLLLVVRNEIFFFLFWCDESTTVF